MYQLTLLLALLASAIAEDVCLQRGEECLEERVGHSMIQVKGIQSKGVARGVAHSGGLCEECIHVNCEAEMAQCTDALDCESYQACAKIAEETECTKECKQKMKGTQNKGTCKECVHLECEEEFENCADTEDCEPYRSCTRIAKSKECTKECGSSQGRREIHQMNSMLEVKGSQSNATAGDANHASGGVCQECVQLECEDEWRQCQDTEECKAYQKCADIARTQKCTDECDHGEGTQPKDAAPKKGLCLDCVHLECEAELEQCADDEKCEDYHKCMHLAKSAECAEECQKGS